MKIKLPLFLFLCTLTLLFLPFFLIGCNGQHKPKYKYSNKEANQFLDEIVANAKVGVGDITETEKLPTDDLYILTSYPLSKATLTEYVKNNGFYLKNKDDDISDFATYTINDYELLNEKNEKLNFVKDGRMVYLREGGLGKIQNIESQNLIIDIKLNKKYKKLKGYIKITFEMPESVFGKIEKEVKIPVQITVPN